MCACTIKHHHFEESDILYTFFACGKASRLKHLDKECLLELEKVCFRSPLFLGWGGRGRGGVDRGCRARNRKSFAATPFQYTVLELRHFDSCIAGASKLFDEVLVISRKRIHSLLAAGGLYSSENWSSQLSCCSGSFIFVFHYAPRRPFWTLCISCILHPTVLKSCWAKRSVLNRTWITSRTTNRLCLFPVKTWTSRPGEFCLKKEDTTGSVYRAGMPRTRLSSTRNKRYCCGITLHV